MWGDCQKQSDPEVATSLQLPPGPPIPSTRPHMSFLLATNTIQSAMNVARKVSEMSDMLLSGLYLLYVLGLCASL